MNAKTKFMNMFYKLPEKARQELVYDFVRHPMTINIIMMEIKMDTELGKRILINLGYYDDEVG